MIREIKMRGFENQIQPLLLASLLTFLFIASVVEAHQVDLPGWAKASPSCVVDVLQGEDETKMEIDLTRSDTLLALGMTAWEGPKPVFRMCEKIKSTLMMNGVGPIQVQPLPPTKDFERWMAVWPGKSPASFELKMGFFDSLGRPGWCRVYVIKGPFDILSDQTFQWPRPLVGQSVWWKFLQMGYTHILPEGLDHILFVLGLCLVAPTFRSLLIQITAFTLAHTLTLGLAARGIIALHSNVVEPLIALSIALVAVENLLRKGVSPWRWMVVFGFGLVHGMGFAGALHETSLPQDAFLSSLLSFNLGVEAGQVTVVGLAMALVWPLREKPWYRRGILIPASLIIGLVGIVWAFQRISSALS